MSKLKKQLRAYFDENLNHADQYDQIATKANLQSTKKENKIFMSKKLLLRIALPCFLGLALIGTIIGITLSRNVSDDPGKGSGAPAAVIQMDVNPSLSLVVDDNNVVISVYGENDEGKMIITDVELVGLSIDVAIEKIITEEVNTGYLIKGNIAAEENEISFVIEADTQKISTALETKLNEITANVCEELKVQHQIKVESIKENTKQSLVARAMELDPTAIKEDLEAKSNQELINYIAGCQLEKVEIPTEELVALYDRVKTSKINLVENEHVVATIDALDKEVYQEFKTGYATLINSLKEANTALETAYFNYFIKADSDYQKALVELTNLKQEVIKLRAEVAEMETNSLLKPAKELELAAKESALILAEQGLQTAANIAKQVVDQLQVVLDGIIADMEEFQATLPDEIKTALTSHVAEVETKINEAKDNSFKYFEENYKAEIELAIAQAKAQKAALVDQLK